MSIPLTPKGAVIGLRIDAERSANRDDAYAASFLYRTADMLEAAIAVVEADLALDAAEEKFGDGCLGDLSAERAAAEEIELLERKRHAVLVYYRGTVEV